MSDRVSGGMALPRELVASEGELRAEAVRTHAERLEQLSRSRFVLFQSDRKTHVWLEGYFTWADLQDIAMDHRLDVEEDG